MEFIIFVILILGLILITMRNNKETSKKETKNKQIKQKKEKKRNLIPCAPLYDDFEEFLNCPKNKRLFISGGFGVGKTTFLNEFFTNHSKQYQDFQLFPVQYQINSSENIIELIKYDLLLKILSKEGGKEAMETVLDNDESKVYFNYLNSILDSEVLSSGVKSVSYFVGLGYPPVAVLGNILGRTIEEAGELKDLYNKIKEESKLDQKKEVDKILEETSKINESDLFSEFLRKVINELCANDQKSILIVDDLDRIHPDHIFKILNTFWGYLDLETNRKIENKLGFDKILLVGNKKNIKNIYHHLYGSEANFGGFFDKFTSYSTYEFNNKKIVEKHIDEYINKLQKESEESLEGALEKSGIVRGLLKNILICWVRSEHQQFNLRKLNKLSEFADLLVERSNYQKQYSKSETLKECLNFSIKVLRDIIDGEEELIKSLQEVKDLEKLKEEEEKYYDRIYPKIILEEVRGEEIFKLKASSFGHTSNGNRYSLKLDKKAEKINLRDNSKRDLFYDLLIDYIREGYYRN